MKLSVGEAAKATGLSRQAIQAAIKKGTISATKGAKGNWQIDPAELFRVYQPAKQDDTPILQNFTSLGTEKDAEIRELSANLKAAHELLEHLQAQNEDLKAEREAWKQQAHEWMLMTTKALPASEPKRSFWSRVLKF